MKWRVAFVITRPERGGAQGHVLELLRGLPDPGAATLISGADADSFLLDAARGLGASVRVLPDLVQPLSPWRDLRALWALRRALRELRPDLVHAHSSKAGLLARLAARSLGVPCVFTAHGWAFTEGVGWPRRSVALALERLVSPLGEVITVSAYDRALALRLHVGRARHMVTVRNGLPDADVPRAALPGGVASAERPLRVMMVARFSEQKDQRLLIRAARRVPEVRLLLVGDGPGRAAAEQLAGRLGVDAEFLGSRADVPALLAGAHVFALISRFEGFPISTIEAMRAGLPLLLSDVGGSGEVLVAGEAPGGLLVPRGDEDALVRALRTLAGDPGLLASLGAASRSAFLRHFTEGEMRTRTWAVYERAVRNGR